MELGIPVVMAVNMVDLLEKSGDKIHTDKLAGGFGCEVVEISALKGTGIDKVVQKAVETANTKKKLTLVHKFSSKAEQIIQNVEDKLSGIVPEEQKRFFAVKLLEKDDKIAGVIKDVPDVNAEIKQLEEEFDDDTESIITNERYVYISNIIDRCITKKNRKEKLTVSDKIDKIVTNRFLALPIFAVVMILVYYISVTTVGTWATDWTNDGLFGDGWHLFGIGSSAYNADLEAYAKENVWIDAVAANVEAAATAGVVGADDILNAMKEEDFGAFEEAYGSYADALSEAGYNISEVVDAALSAENVPDTSKYGVWVPGIPVIFENLLETLHCADWLTGLIVEGIVGGVGAVLGFVPQMLVLFLFLAFLEACGYMARVAFIYRL